MSSPEVYSDDVFADDVTGGAYNTSTYNTSANSQSVADAARFLHEQAKAQEWTLECQRREIENLRERNNTLDAENNTLDAENKNLREQNKKFRANEQKQYENDKSKWLSKSKPAGFGHEKRSADTERFIINSIIPRIRSYKVAQAVLLYLNTRISTKRNSQAKPSTPATPGRLPSRDKQPRHESFYDERYRDQATSSTPTTTRKLTKPTKTTKPAKRPRIHTPPRKRKRTRRVLPRYDQEAQGYSSRESDTEPQLSDPENIFSTVNLVSSSEEY